MVFILLILFGPVIILIKYWLVDRKSSKSKNDVRDNIEKSVQRTISIMANEENDSDSNTYEH